MSVKNKIKTSWLIATFVFFIGSSNAFGQEPVPSPSPQASPSETARPLYGLQGVLIETLDGKVVSSQAENEPFNPASTMKLATALVALRTLGPEHRFATGVWTDGVLDKATGVITGNLYISGRDPSFHYEHGVLLARELNALDEFQRLRDALRRTSLRYSRFDAPSRRSNASLEL